MDDALPPPSRPRGAQHAVRSGCCAFRLSVCLPLRLAVLCWVSAGARGGDRGGERGRGGRLFEVTEIATTDDKMLMEEMLNNITWTSTGARHTDLLLNFLAVCDSA